MAYAWTTEAESESIQSEKLPKGRHRVRISKIKFGDRNGELFNSKNGDPQILLIYADREAREASQMITLSPKAAWTLAKLMSACDPPINLKRMEEDGVEPHHFADGMDAGLKGVDEMWERFRKTRSPEIRDQLICIYSRKVVGPAVAQAVRRLPGHIQFEDVYAAAMIGLWEAIEKYDPGRTAKFETFANTRVRGAIVDWLRDYSDRSRSLFVAVRRMLDEEEAFFNRRGFRPLPEELGECVSGSFSPELISRVLGAEGRPTANISQLGYDSLYQWAEHQVDSKSDNTDARIRLESMAEHLFRGLHADERTMMRMYHIEGLTMNEIGRAVGLSESRVFQILSAALKLVRSNFTEAQIKELVA